MICGFGPFSDQPDPPRSGVAFYVNDFELADPCPWKIPAQWSMDPDLGEVRKQINGAERPRVSWESPVQAGFAEVYASIMAEIEGGALVKSVPVLTERGTLRGGDLEALVHEVDGLPASFFSYGYRRGETGLLGATPELLFSLHGRQLVTMALAGPRRWRRPVSSRWIPRKSVSMSSWPNTW